MFKYFLWFLKIGGILNGYFFLQTFDLPLSLIDFNILLPAQIFFFVSSFRCFFPVNYNTQAVLHNSILSSVFLTRFLATFSEIAYIYLFGYILRMYNHNQNILVELLSWGMTIQVIASQFFVWVAILTKRTKLYYYEEIGWFIIFIFNTIASIILYFSLEKYVINDILLLINLCFGAVYLSWQLFHLKSILDRVQLEKLHFISQDSITLQTLRMGLIQSIYLRKSNVNIKDWGGIIGLTWMFCYWASLLPIWIYFILKVVS